MKRMISFLILAMTATVWLSGCAKHGRYHDQAMPDPQSFNAHFEDMDTDADDSVSWDEFKANFPQADRKIYDALDLNRDGDIDHDEWHAFKEAHGLKHIE